MFPVIPSYAGEAYSFLVLPINDWLTGDK